MSTEMKLALRDLGFVDLVKALATWTMVLLVVALIIDFLAKSSLAAFINEDPLRAARYFAEFFVAVVSPWTHPQLVIKICQFLGILPTDFYMLSTIVDTTLITLFLQALLSSLRLWSGVRTVWSDYRSIPGLATLIGASLSLAGSSLALIGLALILLTDASPIVVQGMRLTLNPLFVFASIPFPWPMVIGTMLWVLGIGVIGAILLILFIKGKNLFIATLMAMLIIGVALSMIGMLLIGFALMTIAVGLSAIISRGAVA